MAISSQKTSAAAATKAEAVKKENVGPVQLDPRAAKPILNKAQDAAKKAEEQNAELQKQLEGL